MTSRALFLLLISFPVYATFPTETSSGGNDFEFNSQTHAVNIGSPSSGDLSVVTGQCNDISATNTLAITPPSGYTLVTSSGETNYSSIYTSGMWTKVAAGSEGATQTFTTNVNAYCSWTYRRYAASTFDSMAGTNGVECASTAYTSTGTPNPPSLSPTGGAKDYYWITYASGRGDFGSYTAPSGYSAMVETQDGVTSGNASASKTAAAASDNPGTWDIGGSANAFTATCAVHPAAPPAASIAGMSRFQGRPGRPNR